MDLVRNYFIFVGVACTVLGLGIVGWRTLRGRKLPFMRHQSKQEPTHKIQAYRVDSWGMMSTLPRVDTRVETQEEKDKRQIRERYLHSGDGR